MLRGCDSLEIGDGIRVANVITPLRESLPLLWLCSPISGEGLACIRCACLLMSSRLYRYPAGQPLLCTLYPTPCSMGILSSVLTWGTMQTRFAVFFATWRFTVHIHMWKTLKSSSVGSHFTLAHVNILKLIAEYTPIDATPLGAGRTCSGGHTTEDAGTLVCVE